MSRRLIGWLLVFALLMGVPPAVFAQTAYNLGQGVGVPNTWSALQTFSTGLTVSGGKLLLPDGTASAPSIAPSSSPTNGIFFRAGYGWPTIAIDGGETLQFARSGSLVRLLNQLSGTGGFRLEGNFTVDLYPEAADTLALRNGINAQTFRLYNTFTDASNYERGFMRFTSNVLRIGAESAGSGTARNTEIIGGTGTTSTLTLQSTSGVGASGADIVFKVGNNGATEAMRILNSGNVGIANPSPAAQLHITSPSSGAADGQGLRLTNGVFNQSYELKTGSPGVNNNDLTLKDITNNATRLTITSAGNTGFGTTGPNEKLEVAGNIRVTGGSQTSPMLIGNNGADNSGVQLKAGASAGIYGAITVRGNWNGTTNIGGYTTFETAGVERLRITEGGNAGFGTATLASGQKVEINGGLNLTTATAEPTCSSTTRGTFWVVQSATLVKDRVEVCAKAADDTYAWRVLY